jgi:hypothetical protein
VVKADVKKSTSSPGSNRKLIRTQYPVLASCPTPTWTNSRLDGTNLKPTTSRSKDLHRPADRCLVPGPYDNFLWLKYGRIDKLPLFCFTFPQNEIVDQQTFPATTRALQHRGAKLLLEEKSKLSSPLIKARQLKYYYGSERNINSRIGELLLLVVSSPYIRWYTLRKYLVEATLVC